MRKTKQAITTYNQHVSSKLNANSKVKAFWNFFPTPSHLVDKMLSCYEGTSLPHNILEPSAGKGDIVNCIYNKTNGQSNIYAYELVDDLRTILLKQNRCTLIGRDFLSSVKHDIKFDLILMNPPFDLGVEHVLHAWDLLEEGKVIALLNQHSYYSAFNPYRLKLKALIDAYGAIENLGYCFKQGVERTANVEVIMITLNKHAGIKYTDHGIDLQQFSYRDIRQGKACYSLTKTEV